MRWLIAVGVSVATCVAVWSCGSDRSSFGGDETDGGSPGSFTEGGGAFGEGGAGDGASGNTTTCSSDLHDVLDSAGNVLETCPDSQGCAAGACVPACSSADANKSTIGCSYWLAHPGVISETTGGCFAAFVVNTWNTPVKIAVDRGGVPLDVASMARVPTGSGQALTYAPLTGGDQLAPGQVAIVFLSRSGSLFASCPAGVTPGFTTAPASVDGTGLGTAFHIATSAPVVAYDIYPYGGGQSAATSATLLLPTSAWDTNYIAVNAYRKSTIAEAQPFLQVVAQEDGTEVDIAPVAAIVAGTGVVGTAAGASGKYMLQKGQMLQIEQPVELSGSPIQATKPIAVFGGASCLSIDVGAVACDSAHQQLPPVRALGSEYVGVRYRNRFDGVEESPPWRLVGAVAGTTLTYDPAPPPGAPTTLAFGQVAEFAAPGPISVKSQDDKHPFYLSAHMTGWGTVGTASDARGDPEYVNVIPPSQYLSSYIFFTDPTYPETELVVVRSKSRGAFQDVTLDCAGVLTGWQAVGASGAFESTRVDLVRGNFAKQGTCDNGRHAMKSSGPFGVTIWGWGSAATGGTAPVGGSGGDSRYSQAVSYAYPAGASVKPVNTVVVSAGPR